MDNLHREWLEKEELEQEKDIGILKEGICEQRVVQPLALKMKDDFQYKNTRKGERLVGYSRVECAL